MVRLLGFATLSCGCVTGRYRELASTKEVFYVEEKGSGCAEPHHRRNHTLSTSPYATPIAPPVTPAVATRL
jgi:hypothetical protein